MPATPDSLLADKTREVGNQEGKRLGLNVKVVERAGNSLKQQLVKMTLGWSIHVHKRIVSYVLQI